MLNGTFTSSSVRAWRQEGETGNIVLPVTFNFVNQTTFDSTRPVGPILSITDDGQLIFGAGFVGNVDSNNANRVRLSWGYLNNYANYRLTNDRPVYYNINGSGNLMTVNDDSNLSTEIYRFNNNFTFDSLSNIANVIGPTGISGDGSYIALIAGGNTNVYTFDGTTATLQTTLPISGTSISINETGNYIYGNGKIYKRTGNTWAFEANVTASGWQAGKINNYGNIVCFVTSTNNSPLYIYGKSGNTWTQLNAFSPTVAGLNARRWSVDMNGDGTVIAASVRYTFANNQPSNNNHRINICNFDSANGNFQLTQNLYQTLSNIDLTIDTLNRSIAMSKNTGYLVSHWGGSSVAVQGLYLYSCLQ